jgi:hypothetical protein
LKQSKKELWVSPLPKDCLQENDFDFTKKICGTMNFKKKFSNVSTKKQAKKRVV